MKINLGDGRNTLFWKDCWHSEIPLGIIYQVVFQFCSLKECFVKILQSNLMRKEQALPEIYIL